MKRTMLQILLAVLIFSGTGVRAYASEDPFEDTDTTYAPYFFVEGGKTDTENFPLKETKVTANINGAIADIRVTQVYANGGAAPINARYVFPASTRVSVHGMTMEIGNQRVTAQIKEREEAKEEFEEAKEEGKSASLLEQERPNVFTMDVANIMPGDTVNIELHYTEMIVSTEGVHQFVFPTVVGPRYTGDGGGGDAWTANPYLHEGTPVTGQYDIAVHLSSGVPVSEVKSPSHMVDIHWNGETSADISLSNRAEYAGDRDYILEYKLTGEEINGGLMLSTGEENFFMLTVQPPERVEPAEIPSREYIFVLDVSGSMYGTPLDTAKSLLSNLVSELRPTDKFNVVLFSGTSALLSSASLAANSANVENALNFMGTAEGGGGTELYAAVSVALGIPKAAEMDRSVVLITDGYISEENEAFHLVNRSLGQANFFAFGIGSSVNRHLIEGIAAAGQGEPFVVTEESEMQTAADRFREYIKSPVLTDVDITYEGFGAYEVEPRSVPALFAQRPLTVFGKWNGKKTGIIRVTGKTGSGEFVKEISVVGGEIKETNTALKYLWARARLDRLIGFGGDLSEGTKKEITGLGIKYSLLSPFTSFIAVIEEIRNPQANAEDVNQPLPLPLGVSDLAVGYAVGSEPGTVMIAAAVVIFAGMVLRKRKRGAKV